MTTDCSVSQQLGFLGTAEQRHRSNSTQRAAEKQSGAPGDTMTESR